MKVDIKNRYDGRVMFSAEIDACYEREGWRIQLGAALRIAIKDRADLSGADLSGAYLSGAYLSGADLSGAHLSGADLRSADLSGAKYDDKTLWPPMTILAEGAIIGWKSLRDGVIAKLEIPAKAARVNSTGRKCRAAFVKVLALQALDGSAMPKGTVGVGKHDASTKYRVGKITRPDSFNDDFRLECTNGIHFFITRAEAENY